MITPTIIIFGIVLPAIISAVILFIAWNPWRSIARIDRYTWGGPLAIGLAYSVGHLGLHGIPSVPPVEALQWLGIFSILALILGFVQWIRRDSALYMWSVRIILTTLMLWFMLAPRVNYTWSKSQAFLWMAGLFLLVIFFWDTIERLAGYCTGYFVPLVLSVVSGGTSVVLLISGSALLGHLGGILAIITGLAFLLSVRQRAFTFIHGASVPLVIILTGLWLTGYFYSEAPASSIVLLILVPLFSKAGRLLPRALRGSKWESITGIAVTVLLTGIAVLLAISSSPPLDYGY